MDENPFARLHVRFAQKVQRAGRTHEHGASLLEGHGDRLAREETILRHARELGMCGELVAARAIHRIAWRELRHTGSDAFNGAGEIDA
jgi:hypothetical protein